MTILHKRLRSRRIQREQTADLRMIGSVMLGCLGFASVGAMLSLVIIETIAGCGEVEYNYFSHTWRTLPCVFVPYTPVMGTW